MWEGERRRARAVLVCVGAAGDAIAADEAPAAIGLRLGDAVRAVVPAPPSRRRPLEARREERVVDKWRRERQELERVVAPCGACVVRAAVYL